MLPRLFGRALVPLLALVACVAPPRAPSPNAVVIEQGDARRVIEPGSAVTFAIWSSRPLPRAAVRGAPAVPGVVSAGAVRGGLVDLRAVRGATRRIPRARGEFLPVSVLAVDPTPLAYGHATAPLARALLAGRAALTHGAAGLRGMTTGDALRIARNGRASWLEVGDVVEENDLFDRELIIPMACARGLGLPPARALLLAVEPDAAATATEALMASLDGHPARVLPLDEPGLPSLMPIAGVKRTFGEFSFDEAPGAAIAPNRRWVARSIVERRVPVLGRVRCHRLIIHQLHYAMLEIRARGLADLIESYNGCYVPRMQRESAQSISMHAFGIALDVNAATNRQGDTPALDPRIVEIMEKWGFTWGGRWLVPDGMHFEFARFVRAAT